MRCLENFYSPDNVYILPIMLYGSECWTVNKADVQRIDATDQWCLRRILGIKWHDFVRNEVVRQLTRQPPLSLIVRSRRLSLFGHVARMDVSADICRLLFEQPAENWRRPPGRPRSTWLRNVADDLKEFDTLPLTLMYELDLKILKMHLHTKNELSRSRLS